MILLSAGELLHLLYYNYSVVARWLLVLMLLSLLFIILFGVYVLITFLLLNTISVFKKEKRTLANCLTLVLAIAIIGYLISMQFINMEKVQPIIYMLLFWIRGMIFFYFAHITQYMTATVLCSLSRPKKKQNYIIINGAWIKNGRLTPLVAGRVEKAIKFYREQKEKGKPPKLIFSGGKGDDESISEAEAMAAYAKERGIPENDMLLESKSVSTLENMRFSKTIMDEDSKGNPYNAIYATSSYHLLRTGIYARKAGLKICGIGSKTAFYYLPNALLREYIAYIVMHWKINAAFLALGLLSSCVIGILASMAV